MREIAAASVVQSRVVHQHSVICVLEKGMFAQDGIVEVCRALDVQITEANPRCSPPQWRPCAQARDVRPRQC